MPTRDEVPEADRLEQEAVSTDDEGAGSPDLPVDGLDLPADAPDADAYEQRLPPVAGAGPAPLDAERIEPTGDEWDEEG